MDSQGWLKIEEPTWDAIMRISAMSVRDRGSCRINGTNLIFHPTSHDRYIMIVCPVGKWDRALGLIVLGLMHSPPCFTRMTYGWHDHPEFSGDVLAWRQHLKSFGHQVLQRWIVHGEKEE